MSRLNPACASDFLPAQFKPVNIFNFDLQALRHLGVMREGPDPSAR
jgi:hypothetical protein